MNKHILNTENQIFINKNINTDISSLMLKSYVFKGVNLQEIALQIAAKKKSEKKLPSWYNTANIYYPTKLSIEQTSSENTAQYKSNLVSGNSLIDLTGGFGVDCFYFSKRINTIIHCELNEKLSEIVKHNYEVFKINNISTIATDGIEYLTKNTDSFDWIYLDPSRRSDAKGKVFMLQDCLPNVPDHLPLLFRRSNNIMIKTSPMLDIKNGIKELRNVKSIHIVSLKNEVKELLWILEKDFEGPADIKTINIKTNDVEKFDFSLEALKTATPTFSEVKDYLYEPNSAILKSGAFNLLSEELKISKLHPHSHLYTSDKLISFPGRSFQVIETLPYHKKNLKSRFKGIKANITVRNFPESVSEIRNKLKIKDGGENYIFFSTDNENNKIAIFCKKI